MRVFIASPLHSYTGGRGQLEATGATVAEVLADLERRYPGIRFRIVDEQDRVRPHMRIYLGTEPAASLSHPIPPGQEIHILQALSGGQGSGLEFTHFKRDRWRNVGIQDLTPSYLAPSKSSVLAMPR